MSTQLQRIYPPGGRSTPPEIAETLDFAALAPPDRPYLALNMVSTADGKVEADGRSGGIGDAADRELFHALRTRVDAVMAGAGTVRAERYGRLVADEGRRARREQAGLDPDPLAIVVSASLALSSELPLLAAPSQRVLVITSSQEELPGVAARVEYLRAPEPLELAPLLARVRSEHGVRSILCEGGPTLNAALLGEGLVDELFLSLAPKLAGGDALTPVAGEALPEPAELELAWGYLGDSSLFLRYLVARRNTP